MGNPKEMFSFQNCPNCYRPEMSKLGLILTITFLSALVLGPGPGAMWIDGTAETPAIWFGVPALYLWSLFWFAVMSACVVIAALTVWKKP